MEVIIKKNKYGVFNSELFKLLKSLPDEKLFYKEHNSRHPISEYNISIKRIDNAINNLINILYIDNQESSKIDLAYTELIESVISYIDMGYKIMKSLYPKSRVKGNIVFSDKWLEKVNKKAISLYKSDIDDIRKTTSVIVNDKKHNNATCVYVEGSTKYGKVLGFYLEEIDENGVVVPKKNVHRDFDGEKTAMSYNKEILNQIANVVFISRHMEKIIKKLFKEEHNITLNIGECDENDSGMVQLIQKANNVRMIFFPNEYNGELSQIRTSDGELKVKRPSPSRYYDNLLKPNNYGIGLELTLDGMTTTYTLPYFKEK